jgi:hypothetical protein
LSINNTECLRHTISRAKQRSSAAHFIFYSVSSFFIIIITPLLGIITKIKYIQCLKRGGVFLKYFSFYEFLRLPDDIPITGTKHVVNLMTRIHDMHSVVLLEPSNRYSSDKYNGLMINKLLLQESDVSLLYWRYFNILGYRNTSLLYWRYFNILGYRNTSLLYWRYFNILGYRNTSVRNKC